MNVYRDESPIRNLPQARWCASDRCSRPRHTRSPMNESEIWLSDWHTRHPGATSRALSNGRPSSYEWLAALASPSDRVLDLACGDGYLMERLRARGVTDLVGVDMTEAELTSARARLGGAATLVQARAQE